MISVFDYCEKKWSQKLISAREDVLKKFQLLILPHDLDQLRTADPNFTIVLQNQGSLSSALRIHEMGFRHTVHLADPDLDREILLSIILEVNPTSLLNHKVPFYFFDMSFDKKEMKNPKTVLSMEIENTSEMKDVTLALELKIQDTQFRAVLKEAVLFAADELIGNALKASRYSGKRKVLFQAGFNSNFCNLSCTDYAGQLDRGLFLTSLIKEFSNPLIEPQLYQKSAGIGLRSVIQNSSSFYAYCEPAVRTIVACRISNEPVKKMNARITHLHI